MRRSTTIAACVLLVCAGCGHEREQSSGPATAGQPQPVQAVFVGDSYTAESVDGGGYVPRLASAMGWTPALEAVGGTGYVKLGTTPEATPYASRLDAVVADDPDVVVVQGSTNDVGEPVAAVGAAATAFYATLQERLGDVSIVVVGPLSPPGVDREGVLAVRDVLATVADQAGLLFIDPIAAGWLTERPDVFYDQVHPDQPGYEEMADDLAEALRDAGF